jgi:gamma-glutamylputrescine oxidase
LLTDYSQKEPAYDGAVWPIDCQPLPAQTEVLVVGSGLLGLSAALDLARAGKNVVVVEANRIGQGPSGRSGGQLWPGFGSGIGSMLRRFGSDITAQAWHLTHDALQVVHHRASVREDLCEFSPGVLLTSKNDRQADWIKSEARLLEDGKWEFASYVSAKEIQQNYVNTRHYLNAILFKGTSHHQYGHINPLKYTQTVALLAKNEGANLIENCIVTGVEQNSSGEYVAATSQGSITAQSIVLAAGAGFMRPKGIDFELIPRSYIPTQTLILATEPIDVDLANEMVPGDVCFCDASPTSMYYGRLVPVSNGSGGFRLTLGGADALSQLFISIEVAKISRELRQLFPQIEREGIAIEKIWGGYCDLSRTEFPVLLNPLKGLFYAAGFSGQGMVNTTLYGAAIADKILHKHSPSFELLQKINSSFYSENKVHAYLQAASHLWL